MSYPLKISWKTELLPVLAILAVVMTALLAYPLLPDKVVSHWNFNGEPDNWSSKNFQAICMPLLIIGMYLMFFVFTALDPKRERYQEFAKVFHFFRYGILLVLSGVYIATTLANLGYPVSISKTVSLLIGALMIMLGNYMGKIKQNWFFGIKTPWTLSSENVWNKTHRLGGWMFILFGIILIIDPYFKASMGLALFIVGIILVMLPIAYSYYLYRKER